MQASHTKPSQCSSSTRTASGVKNGRKKGQKKQSWNINDALWCKRDKVHGGVQGLAGGGWGPQADSVCSVLQGEEPGTARGPEEDPVCCCRDHREGGRRGNLGRLLEGWFRASFPAGRRARCPHRLLGQTAESPFCFKVTQTPGRNGMHVGRLT